MARVLFTIFLMAGLVACAALSVSPAPTRTLQPAAPLVIYADTPAANVLRDIGVAFMQANPGSWVEWTFAKPEELRAKLETGPPPDVLVSADRALLQIAERTSTGAAPKAIAQDPLVVVVTNANPGQIERAEDLNRSGLRAAIAQENTMLGQATRALIENFRHDAAFGPDFPAQFYANASAPGQDGRAVLNALLEKRADAGIVYASEANTERNRVRLFGIADGLNVPATYFVVPLQTEHNAGRIASFTNSLSSAQAQTLWRDYGFEPVP